MAIAAVPAWTSLGVLPPVNPVSPTATDRAPYEVSLSELVLRFNTSPERHAILEGFLDFRQALQNLGFIRGYQWLDGSFLEDVESLERRPPRDLDVVTFYDMPTGQTQRTLIAANPGLFTPSDTKRKFRVDAYFVQLDGTPARVLVRSAAYWYSMWSHRRDGLWKGYLQVDLGTGDDPVARASLTSAAGGQP